MYKRQAGWTGATAWKGSADFTLALDYDNDEDLDLFVCAGAEGHIVAHGEESWSELEALKIILPGIVHDASAVDFDHDGDLDILCVGDFGARLYRNDGADEPESGGAFNDASEAAKLPTEGAWRWCLICLLYTSPSPRD